MTPIKAFITRHPVLTYYVLVFTISWGGFLLVGGSGFFAGTSWQTDPLFLFALRRSNMRPATGVVKRKPTIYCG